MIRFTDKTNPVTVNEITTEKDAEGDYMTSVDLSNGKQVDIFFLSSGVGEVVMVNLSPAERDWLRQAGFKVPAGSTYISVDR